MESNVLQPISGTECTKIYPYIRRVDLMSSNSYILSCKDQIALIDPGGQDDQMDHLAEVIGQLQDSDSRPVVTYLTHVHVDHCIQLARYKDFKWLKDSVLAVQEIGAIALERQDPRITLSEILGRDLAGVSAEVRLLSAQDIAKGSDGALDLDRIRISYTTRSMEINKGLYLQCQILPLGQGDHLEIYHTPGHSPDSICINIGDTLFIGDLLFAPNPGNAGTTSWSKEDFLMSIARVLWILDHKGISTCYSGHGRNMDAEAVRRTLVNMYREVEALDGLAEINLEWVKQTGMYAIDLMRELERLFTIIGGRLAFISHILEELEECGEAENMGSLVKIELIEGFFNDFRQFSEEVAAGRKLDWEMVHKVGQITRKLESLINQGKLGSVLDQSLLRRISRMLNDYTIIYRGFRPPCYVSDIGLNLAVLDVLDKLSHKPYEDEAILEAANEEEFLLALKMRIAHVNLFEDVALDFEAGRSLQPVRMDVERFSDAFVDVLERLIGAGARKIRITTSSEDIWSVLRIEGYGSPSYNPFSNPSQKFIERMFALCGGLMQTYLAGEGPVLEIEFVSSAAI